MNKNTCKICGQPLPETSRSSRKYCTSKACYLERVNTNRRLRNGSPIILDKRRGSHPDQPRKHLTRAELEQVKRERREAERARIEAVVERAIGNGDCFGSVNFPDWTTGAKGCKVG